MRRHAIAEDRATVPHLLLPHARSASVHGHGEAERLGNFLFGAAGLEASIGVEGAAVVATRSDGPTDGDELHLFAKKGAFEVRGGKSLIVLRESGQSLGNPEMDLVSSAC